jgi:hypothetical protein
MSGLMWIAGGDLTWYDTHPGVCKRGFCPSCGSHLAAVDYGNEYVIGINVTALKDPNDPLLVPTNLHRLRETAPWLAELLRDDNVPAL